MSKLSPILVFLCLFLSFNSYAAATLDEATINSIYQETKLAYIKKCVKDFKEIAPRACTCLADMTLKYIDRAALRNCKDDATGTKCISDIVATAAMQSTTKENMDLCNEQVQGRLVPRQAPTSTSLAPSGQPETPSESTTTTTTTTSDSPPGGTETPTN